VTSGIKRLKIIDECTETMTHSKRPIEAPDIAATPTPYAIAGEFTSDSRGCSAPDFRHNALLGTQNLRMLLRATDIKEQSLRGRKMLTSANVSAAQAASYYEKDDYYTRGETGLESDTKWQGQGAASLHLEGPVDQQVFQQLLQGQTPDGQSLHSRQIDPTNHRAATDYTFSAPKSVSIAALIQKDKRVIQAHDQAVKTALNVLENRYAQTRVRRGPGIRERVQTGNIIAATFRHETSREQDPQLHTHCVIINATQLADGRWQSMANEEVLNNQKLLGEIYQNELAVQLRQVGYEIEPQGNGVFECKGYEKPLLELFSTRTQQIEQYIERWEASLKETGGKPLHAKQKKQATLATRLRKKTVPREVLLDGWHRAIASHEIHLPPTPKIECIEIQNQAPIAAVAGVSHAAERESVFKREKAERFALEHHLGEQSFAELQSAMTEAGMLAAKERFTTEEAIARELDTIAIMNSGQGQVDAISNPIQVMQLTTTETTLTIGQYKAILETATSRDQFMAWQGVAGAGKTYSLKLLAHLATEQDYEVTGYAPSAEAANVLEAEANIESNTVARLLQSDLPSDEPKPAIWIVDEAGLLSAKDAHALLKKAQSEKARVILVGDTRQLSAVEAGNPFKSLQLAGMKTAFLEESRRQKTAVLRSAVVCLSAGEPSEGLQQLDKAGMVHELTSSEERHAAIACDYLSLPPEARAQTLILSGTNIERLALTAELRALLQQEGSLGADTFTLRSLRSRDLTTAQLKYACAYDVGDVVVPVRDAGRYGMVRREQYSVLACDLEGNQLTLQGPDGRQFAFNPRHCPDKTTYRVQEIAIAPGEQLRWTRNEAAPGVRNGQMVTVEAINAQGSAELKDANGVGEASPLENRLTLDLTGQQYLDYALVSTVYNSQGKTADQMFAAIDSTLSKEGLYVAVSRAKLNLNLYTGNKEQLYKKAQRSAAKENPSDYLTLFQLVNPNAENPQTARTARDVYRSDRAEHVGDRAGERIEVSHRATVRRDLAATAGSEPVESRAGSLSPQYVSNVRGVVAGIAERHRIEAIERQAERIGEAAEDIINGARQLAATSATVARLDEQLEQKAERLNGATKSIGQRPSMLGDGVAEVILRSLDPRGLARYEAQIAEAKATELPVEKQQAAAQEDKRRRRRQIYQQYAAKFVGKSPRECDLLVVRQLMSELLIERSGQRLSDDEIGKVGSILLQGPVAQELKQTQGKEAGVTYAMEVLAKVQKVVEKAQRRSHDREMEM
jgi:conjugative relaxase-like TrwC/TraI family protein